MVTRPLAEFHEYITPDSVTYDLAVISKRGRWVISSEGWGFPSTRHLTERDPLGDLERMRVWYLNPRTISLVLRQDFQNRISYWTGRGDLLDAFRPNRGAEGTLRRYLPDGSIRDLAVRLDRGPAFTPRSPSSWDQRGFAELIRFIAPEPWVTDPIQRSVTFSLAALNNLVFPITFPITFGSSLLNDIENLTYNGTWDSFPQIVITGPLNAPIITNDTTGLAVALTYNIPTGRVVTIDLAYGVKTVADDLGVNLIGTVTSVSDLGNWHLTPAPRAVGGVNVIRVQGSQAVAGVSGIALNYFDRYIGI